MTEQSEMPVSPQPQELQLQVQHSFDFANELKTFPNLHELLPTGEIAYYDVRNPGRITLLGNVFTRELTPEELHGEAAKLFNERRKRARDIYWNQFQDPKRHKTYSLEEAVDKTFAGIVVRTPARTPENAYDHDLALLAPLVKERSEKNGKIITKRHMGAFIVVEDIGDNQVKGWRRQQMTNLGLVTTETPSDKAVVPTDKYIISYGRPVKERSAVNLLDGKTSGNMFNDFPDAVERWAERLGMAADTSRLREEAEETTFVPRTLDNLRLGGNVDYQGVDEDGKPTFFSTDKKGEVNSSDKERFRIEMPPNKSRTSEKNHMDPLVAEATVNPGRLIKTDILCNDHSHGQNPSFLSLKYETVETDKGKYVGRIFRLCATHGNRWSTPAPSYKDALVFKKSLAEVQ